MGYSPIVKLAYRRAARGQIKAIFEILEDFFLALEDGSVHHRLPDPTFQPPQGRPPITQELVDEFIENLDREMDLDAFDTQGKKYGADASCEFYRLEPPQRLALVQRLMSVVLSEQEMEEAEE
ncbi:MAG: hypothetical protein BZY88_01610 [SAR202 cluster bacterium Io17-Chloro-G9]|nr:MAG: hypothetical protein BZY88_01610 [SAR202 cluster bacterium Io17-Chloro-G9]